MCRAFGGRVLYILDIGEEKMIDINNATLSELLAMAIAGLVIEIIQFIVRWRAVFIPLSLVGVYFLGRAIVRGIKNWVVKVVRRGR